MSNVIYLVIGLIGGYIIGKMNLSDISMKRGRDSDLVVGQGEEKKKNLDKIIGYFEGKVQVTNNEIEELLGVSDATAERYLDELEHSGKIRQVGQTGKQVTYEKI